MKYVYIHRVNPTELTELAETGVSRRGEDELSRGFRAGAGWEADEGEISPIKLFVSGSRSIGFPIILNRIPP